MSVYKISGTTSHDADVHVIQGGSYFGKKAVTAGNYEVTIDSTTGSGITTVAEKSDGYTVSYGDVEAITSSGVADLTIGGAIKSIQAVNITIPGASLTAAATINEVDPDSSFVLFNGSMVNYEAENGRTLGSLHLTNGTTVTAAAGATGNYDTYVRGYVVELATGAVKSIQRGLVTLPNPGFGDQIVDVTITSVDTNKAFVLLGGITDANDGKNGDMPSAMNVYLTSSTNLRFRRKQQYKEEVKVRWEVVEIV